MTRLVFLIALALGAAGALWRVHARSEYCALACGDARHCGMTVAEPCEEHCERGRRSIDLPNTCEQLQRNVDKAGYLF